MTLVPLRIKSLNLPRCSVCSSFMISFDWVGSGAERVGKLLCPHEHQIRIVPLYQEEINFIKELSSVQRCPHCMATQVDILKETRVDDGSLVFLQCQACEKSYDTVVSLKTVAAFTYNMGRGTFEREVRLFAIALEEETIGPDDFQ